jgi:hypothetical protein
LASFFSSSPGGSFLCLFLLGVSLTYLYSLRLLFGVLALGSGPSVETFSVISCISLLCPLRGLVYIACLLLNVIFVPSVFLGAENSLLYCVGLAIVFVLALRGVHNMRVPG